MKAVEFLLCSRHADGSMTFCAEAGLTTDDPRRAHRFPFSVSEHQVELNERLHAALGTDFRMVECARAIAEFEREKAGGQ